MAKIQDRTKPLNVENMESCMQQCGGEDKGHFTHESKCPWPLHFKHSHW